ncbi:MAG: hypothetical protein HYX78_13635 [Armatimonadetes bacterium]|nr:hypothetical protein [Armatimonadota bacterium]
MANLVKVDFLDELAKRCGPLQRLGGSQSLYSMNGGSARVYIRYSRMHGHRTFYGLRAEELVQLEGHNSFICLLWDNQAEPLFIRYSDYEDVFQATLPAGDGQYKAQVYIDDGGTELYVARAGRFNVEGNMGWAQLERLRDEAPIDKPELSHSQVQTLLGAIGMSKDYDVWLPPADRSKLDWSLTDFFECRGILPHGFESIESVLQEIDVVWVQRGSSEPKAFFEVEHSTPIYSGLLRFNDVHLLAPRLRPRFTVVANDSRRSLFVRQLGRPTFQQSGLADLCTFLDYTDVYGWYTRIMSASDRRLAP